jgi:hypothetical protein
MTRHGKMVFFGGFVFPAVCAVIYAIAMGFIDNSDIDTKFNIKNCSVINPENDKPFKAYRYVGNSSNPTGVVGMKENGDLTTNILLRECDK